MEPRRAKLFEGMIWEERNNKIETGKEKQMGLNLIAEAELLQQGGKTNLAFGLYI